MSDEDLNECLAVVFFMEEEQYEVASYAMYFMTEEQKNMVFGLRFLRAGIRLFGNLRKTNPDVDVLLKI